MGADRRRWAGREGVSAAQDLRLRVRAPLSLSTSRSAKFVLVLVMRRDVRSGSQALRWAGENKGTGGVVRDENGDESPYSIRRERVGEPGKERCAITWPSEVACGRWAQCACHACRNHPPYVGCARSSEDEQEAAGETETSRPMTNTESQMSKLGDRNLLARTSCRAGARGWAWVWFRRRR